MTSLINFILISIIVILSSSLGIFAILKLQGRQGSIIAAIFMLSWIVSFSVSIRINSIILEDLSTMFLIISSMVAAVSVYKLYKEGR